MKGTGKIIKKMVSVLKKNQMGVYMKVNLRMEKKMEQEYIIGKIIRYILEIGQIIIAMVLAFLKMEINLNIKVNFYIIKEMDMES